MANSIISAVREYMNGCTALQDFAAKNRHIDWTDETNNSYGIYQDGEKVVKKFIGGGGKMQYSFTLYVRKVSATDAQRLQDAELLERVQKWCNDNSLGKILPQLPAGCTPTKIVAENAAMVDKGVYQIQFNLFYVKS